MFKTRLLSGIVLVLVALLTICSGGTVLYMTVLYLLVSYLTRILWKDQLKRKMRSSMKRSLLIITTKSMLDTVVYNIRNFNYEMFHVAGVAVIDCDMVGHDCGDSITVVANADTVADYVCREWVDEVFVNLPDDAPYPETLLKVLPSPFQRKHLTDIHASRTVPL